MKHFESGRSFVEMLGMLAVMGLISIAGLYGFTYAMKRLKANELLNEANKRAVVVAGQLMAGKDPGDVTLDEFPPTPYGQFATSLENAGDKFKMTISGLDEEICELLISLAGGPVRRVECVPEETGTFTAQLFFNDDLSTEERASDYNYANCPNNFYKCEINQSCVASAEECVPAACEVLECGSHGSWNETACKCDCDTGWYGKICDSDCDGWKDGWEECNPCSVSYSSESSFEECARCDDTSTPRKLFNTSFFEEFYGEGWGYCGRKSCGEEEILTSEGECVPCDEGGAVVPSSEAECYKCTLLKRHMLGGDCVVKQECSSGTFHGLRLHDGVSYCFSCSDGFSYPSNAIECAKCDDTKYPRKLFTGRGGRIYCGRKDCGSDFFHLAYGECKSCSWNAAFETTPESCSECDNTDYPRKIFTYDGEDWCSLAACPSGNFHQTDGGCVSCSNTYSVPSSAEFCHECDNTQYHRKMDGENCIPNW